MPSYYDFEPRFYRSGVRYGFDPKSLIKLDWELTDGGGLGQVMIWGALLFDDTTFAPQGGDVVEIWKTTGETNPRGRAVVRQPERELDLKEGRVITAYGLAEDLNHVIIDRVYCIPGGADLSVFFASLVSDYQQRRPSLTLVTDIQIVGVQLVTLTLAYSDLRSAFDKLANQTGNAAVWGFDIDPATGNDRIYLRPKQTAAQAGIAGQWQVGDTVKAIRAPAEFQKLANAIYIQGGPAQYPNYFENASFENVTVPAATFGQGNLLSDGSFELGPKNLAPNNPHAAWDFSSTGAGWDEYSLADDYVAAHTGNWFVALATGGYVYQDVALSSPLGQDYQCSLFAKRAKGQFITEGLLEIIGLTGVGGSATTDYASLPLAPQSATWTGGQGTTMLSSDAIDLAITIADTNTKALRIKISGTNVQGASYPNYLCIDDCLLFTSTDVAQYGWWSLSSVNTSLTPAPANTIGTVDWGSPAAAWEGYYGVRINVTSNANTNDTASVAPQGGWTWSSKFIPSPPGNTALRWGFRVRMSPGLNTSDGSCCLVYDGMTDGASGGSQYERANFTIPNDGAWHFVYMDLQVAGNTTKARMNLGLTAAGWYDVDGATARDQAAGEGDDVNGGIVPLSSGYIRGTDFEYYCDVTSPELQSALTTAAKNSITNYGRMEAVVDNDQVVNWDADAQAWAAAYLNEMAVPITRSRVDLTDEAVQIPDPGTGLQYRVSGTADDIPDSWIARAEYSWGAQSGTLAVSLEMTDEQPTFPKFLKSIVSSTGGGQTTIGATAAAAAASGSGSGGGSIPLSFVPYEVPQAVGSSTTQFTVQNAPANGAPSGSIQMFLWRNGVPQAQSVDYTVTQGSTQFVLATALQAGENLIAAYWYTPTS